MRIILNAKYEKADLNKVMNKQFQHLSTYECEKFLALMNLFEDIFDGMLGIWNTKLVYL